MDLKPKMSTADIDAICSAIVAETPAYHRAWLAWGAAACAIVIGFAQHIGALSAPGGTAALLVLGLSHWRARERFGFVPALNRCDAYDLMPDTSIRRIESDPECQAWGIDVAADDWPRIVKTGMRVTALAHIEPFESKMLAGTGYAFALLMLLWV